MLPTMDLATRLRDLRVKAGLTKTALAKPRYTVSFVSQIESGRRRPSSEAAAFFADRLGVSRGYLVTGVPEDIEQVLKWLVEQGEATLRQGRPNEAEPLLRLAKDRAREVDLPSVAGRAHVLLAQALAAKGLISQAIDAYEEAVEGELPERDRGFAVAGLAKLYRTVGDLTYAAELVESFLSRSERSPLAPALVAELQSVLLSIYFERGDIARAERCALRALAVAAAAPSFDSRARSYGEASHVLAGSNRHQEALESATRARVLREEIKARNGMAQLHIACALLCLEADPPRVAEAKKHLDGAGQLAAEMETAGEPAYVLQERGRLALIQGRPDAALILADEALADSAGHELEAGRCLLLKARALAGLGRMDEARKALHEARSMFRERGAHEHEASCWRTLGELDLAQGHVPAAAGALRAGLEALELVRSS